MNRLVNHLETAFLVFGVALLILAAYLLGLGSRAGELVSPPYTYTRFDVYRLCNEWGATKTNPDWTVGGCVKDLLDNMGGVSLTI